MTDIVERLRDYTCPRLSSCWFEKPAICEEAADTIERLREELADVRADAALLRTEIERLRTENESLRRALDVVPGAPTAEDIEWGRRALEPKP